jgi:uncharacterized protein YbjT (DUF2867 family)
MILVTGATGTVGSDVCANLASASVSVRVATRSPERFDGPADKTVAFDFTDPTTYRGAFADVDAMFLVRPPALRVRRDIVPALAAAVGAGVDHVVFLSIIGADRNRIVRHARIESAPVSITFLRASFFMQNLSTTHREEIRSGELIIPAGTSRTSFIDARDVATVAPDSLLTRTTGEYDLTGPEALGYREVCRQLSATLDHEAKYTAPSLSRFLVHRFRTDHRLSKSLVMAGIYTTARLGLADRDW